MQMIMLDGSRMTDPKEAHRYLARALHLPDYYGCNLDALYDCLTSFGDCPIILMEHVEAIGVYGDSLLTVFQDAAKTGSIRFAVLPE